MFWAIYIIGMIAAFILAAIRIVIDERENHGEKL